MSKTILVTGGAGFIGTHLCRRLIEQGHQVISIDLQQASQPIVGVKYILGDVRNLELLEQQLKLVSVVYHLAATVSVPLCQQNPIESYSNNFSATIGILEKIRQQALASASAPIAFIFSSTAAVYGNNGHDGRALKESDAASEFFSFYAAQKHACEKAIDVYSTLYKVPATVFRLFNLYGPGQDPSSPYSGVISVFTKLAKDGLPLPLNGGGRQTRDFVSVYDVVDAFTGLLALPCQKWSPQPINLGAGSKTTIRQLAETINQLHGNTAGCVDKPDRIGDIVHSLSDISRARELIAFNPKRALSAGLLEL